MAATIEARRLTEAHRLAQLRIGSQTIARAFAAYRLLDPANLDATVEQWLAVMLPIVHSGRRSSARLAGNYLSTFRTLELGVDAGRFTPLLTEDITDDQLIASLMVTGPVSLRRSLRRDAAVTARTRVAGAAMRHALNGGRDTIITTVAGDRRALGWARATSGRACHFCAMLASRGPVYSEGSAHFDAHDHCSCSAEPVYRRDAEWPAGAKQYRDLWNSSTEGFHGKDAVNAFRQALAA